MLISKYAFFVNLKKCIFFLLFNILIIIGAINWGLIGFFKFNLVDAIFGELSVISRIIYALVGISGLWGIKLIFDRD